MSYSELGPIKMARVAVVAPRSRLRSVLVEIADAGVMEVDELERADRLPGGVPKNVHPRLSREEPDLDGLRDREAWDLVAGEAELARRAKDAVEHGPAGILLVGTQTATISSPRARS